VGFVVDKVALEQILLRVLRFFLSISFHRGSTLIYHLGDEQLVGWLVVAVQKQSHLIDKNNNNNVKLPANRKGKQ
jgi:hypothetical protein